eukprot:CAMPEP_0194076866 /NCGR_PEP_ID=MMETSP0149-20130528/3615_1 /TAXON_ID=122233 /ORGANISM="Chaetoceros debilis, Strain MM31A-1" /LENGTH=520 /DNA_ID=CAMNT_0038757743 /DNA_START=49 /DNA_END=1611 /DNA_ORIENTATION=+
MAIIESLPLCIALALSSGLCQTLSTACTAYPAYLDRIVNENDETDSSSMADKDKEEIQIFDDDSESFADDFKYSSRSDLTEDAPVETGNMSLEQKAKKVSRRKWVLAYVANTTFAIIGGTVTLFGSWYGPVSLFSPVKQVSQILSNTIMFSYILKTETLPSKETNVGNLMIAIATISLVFVGTEVNEEPINPADVVDSDVKIVFGGVLLCITILITFPYQFILGFTNLPCLTERVNFVLLLVTECVHAVVSTSASKLVPLLKGQWMLFSFVIALMVITIFTVWYSALLRSTFISSQTVYVPLMLSVNVVLNAIMGLIIWDDRIQNLGGYACTYLFLILGVYLMAISTDYNMGSEKGGKKVKSHINPIDINENAVSSLASLGDERSIMLRDSIIWRRKVVTLSPKLSQRPSVVAPLTPIPEKGSPEKVSRFHFDDIIEVPNIQRIEKNYEKSNSDSDIYEDEYLSNNHENASRGSLSIGTFLSNTLSNPFSAKESTSSPARSGTIDSGARSGTIDSGVYHA